jgi:hypothetical protein
VLFASLESQLLGLLPDRTPNPSAADTTLRFFAYSGLALNIGATIDAVLLLIAMTSLLTSARRLYLSCSHGYPRKLYESPPDEVESESESGILAKFLLTLQGETLLLNSYGVAAGWGVLLWHCIFCFTSGCVCAYLHIGISLWLTESTLVAAIVMPSIAVAFALPRLHEGAPYVLFSSWFALWLIYPRFICHEVGCLRIAHAAAFLNGPATLLAALVTLSPPVVCCICYRCATTHDY